MILAADLSRSMERSVLVFEIKLLFVPRGYMIAQSRI
jgi:hypothetical protein